MNSFSERTQDYIQRVEAALDTHMPAATCAPTPLHKAMRHAIFNGGKRIRPLLCYGAGEALGVSPDALDIPACAVELIHGFSLVHDDLPAMDDDDLRRGRPTVHKAFDTPTAILAGDALQTLAFSLLGQSGHATMVATLAHATGSLGMTGGQVMDLEGEHRALTLEQLKTLHRHKTGWLIRAAVLMACDACPNLDGDQRAQLDQYADNIGLAFQIRDDILDIESDTATLGKTAGKDLAQHKSTYPALMGMTEAKQLADTLYDEALALLTPLGDKADGLRWLAAYFIRRER